MARGTLKKIVVVLLLARPRQKLFVNPRDAARATKPPPSRRPAEHPVPARHARPVFASRA